MTNKKINTGLAWFSTSASLSAHAPLIDNSEVDTIQWTVDSLDFKLIPERDMTILLSFADQGVLSGHGVDYAVLSAGGQEQRNNWIGKLKQDPLKDSYCQLSVHFGYSTAWKLKRNAPMPVPYTPEALQTGIKNLEVLADVVQCPVGLENLALAFSKQDVENQGRFLEELLSSIDGFLLLDLHNLYCQSINFGVDMMDLVRSYPLARVKEMHISGGSWSEGVNGRQIRRDTHDHAVPDEIFNIMPQIVDLCPQLRFIFLEQLPSALKTPEKQEQNRSDYRKLREVCAHV